jgi:hypothetical protein
MEVWNGLYGGELQRSSIRRLASLPNWYKPWRPVLYTILCMCTCNCKIGPILKSLTLAKIMSQTQTTMSKKGGVGGGWVCAHCKTAGGLGTMKCCSRCKRVNYCSVECQKSHWKIGGHQRVCGKEGGGGARGDAAGASAPPGDAAPLQNPCPICLDNEDDAGENGMCFSCGQSYCGKCNVKGGGIHALEALGQRPLDDVVSIRDPRTAHRSSAIQCHAVGITYPARVIVELQPTKSLSHMLLRPNCHAINTCHSSGLKLKSPPGVADISRLAV